MAKGMIGLIAVTLFVCLSATPAAAHAFLTIGTGESLPAFGSLSDLGDGSRSFFFTAMLEWGNESDFLWDICGGLRYYASTDGLRPYWGIYGFSERLDDPTPVSRNGFEGVFGYEWRIGKDFQICAFAEAGASLAMEDGLLVCEPVYGLGIGVSLWVY